MKDALGELIDMLRGRVLRGLQAAALAPGDRLPSARELAGDLELDHRLVLSAYRALAAEGLVEARPRGGVYVAARARNEGGLPPLPARFFADVLAQGLSRDIPAPQFHEWLRRCTETRRLRAAVVASTPDQGAGLERELAHDFGLEAEALLADEVRSSEGAALPLAIRRADLLVTTAAHRDWMTTLAASLDRELCVVDVRPDLVKGEWALLFRQPVYAVVADVGFGEMLRAFFADVPGSENLRVVVLGRDDPALIPEDAPTYVTHRARALPGAASIRGRVLPPARTISPASSRALLEFIVRSNVDVLRSAR